MRTSLNEIRLVEEHLTQQLPGDEECVFQANLILDNELAENVQFQKKAYQMIRQYGRKRLKEDLELAYQRLFTEEKHQGFRQKVLRLFNSK